MDQDKAFPMLCTHLKQRRNIWLMITDYITYVWHANGAFIYNEFLAHASNPEGHIYDFPELEGIDNQPASHIQASTL